MTLTLRACLLLCMFTACTGQIAGDTADDAEPASGEGPARPPRPGATGGGAPPPGNTPGTPSPTGPSAGTMPLRLLTRVELDNTVRDLLGDTSRPASALPAEERGPSGFGTLSQVSAVEVDNFAGLAVKLADAALARLDSLAPPCAGAPDETCAASFVERFGRRAFRRPVDATEKMLLVDLYRSVRAAPLSHDHTQAVRVLLQAMLQSPQFLYRWELGPNAPGKEGALVRLNPHELAARLSYLLWRSMPDDTLFAAADANRLGSAKDLEAQARRMLADPKARETVLDFHFQWLSMDKLASTQKDATLYKAFDETLRKAMEAETARFVTHAVLEDGKLETLLTGSTSFVNEPLARLYGIAGVTGAEPRRVDLPPERRGLLNQASFLTIEALPQESSPVRRGKVILERLLCRHLAPPPPGLDVDPPRFDPKKQTRELYAEHSNNPACAGCHAHVDPIGFAFEGFDAIGRHRTEEAGRPVDTSGGVHADGTMKRVANARELVTTLAASSEVRRCVAQQWLQFAFSRELEDADRASVEAATDAFVRANQDVRELLVAIATTPSFLYRRPAAGEVLP